jgi:hypothetical protein
VIFLGAEGGWPTHKADNLSAICEQATSRKVTRVRKNVTRMRYFFCPQDVVSRKGKETKHAHKNMDINGNTTNKHKLETAYYNHMQQRQQKQRSRFLQE